MQQNQPWPTTVLTERLGLRFPIVQAPMAAVATPEMAAAVARAGGLGGLGLGTADVATSATKIRIARQLGASRLNLNLHLHRRTVQKSAPRELAHVGSAMAGEEAGAPTGTGVRHGALPSHAADLDDEWLELIGEQRPEVVTFHFSPPSAETVEHLKSLDVVVGGTATTVAEAQLVEASGCDLVVAQGAEAGGPRGTYTPSRQSSGVGSMSLIPQVVDAVTIPVIAAGGIADARTMAAAMLLGASGVQAGTAFLGCIEAAVSRHHLRALRDGHSEDAVVTRTPAGRPARGFRRPATASPPTTFATYPARAGAERDGFDQAMWAGQSFPLNSTGSAYDVVKLMANGAAALLQCTDERS